jgi:predicted MFS family arabinose efflux permease
VWGWEDVRTIAVALAAISCLVLALLRSADSRAPVIEFDVLRQPTFALANAVALVPALAAFAWLLAGPLFAAKVWGYDALSAALSVAPGALTATVASLLAGRLRARGRGRAIVAGAIVFAATSCVLAATLGNSPLLSVWIVAGALSGAALGGVLASLSATVASAMPPCRFGAGAGINMTARQLGGTVGVALLAALVGASGGVGASDFTIVWLVGAAASVASRARRLRVPPPPGRSLRD